MPPKIRGEGNINLLAPSNHCSSNHTNIMAAAAATSAQPSGPSSARGRVVNGSFVPDRRHSNVLNRDSKNMKAKPRTWKSAIDPKTKRTYYYDSISRQTQWSKPIELASEKERRAIEEKELRQKNFFAVMEANIMKNIAVGSLAPDSTSSSGSGSNDSRNSKTSSFEDFELQEESIGEMATDSSLSLTEQSKGTLLPKDMKPVSRPVRTISSMGDAMLAELVKTDAKVSPNAVLAFLHEPLSLNRPANLGGVSSKSDASVRCGESFQHTLVSHLQSSFPPPTKHGSPLSDCNSQRSDGGDGKVKTSDEDRAVDKFLRTAEEMAALTPTCGATHTAIDGEQGAPTNLDASLPSTSGLPKLPKGVLRYRNTCGTIHVSSTMSDPDKDATIKCVCGVYRAHILQAAREEAQSGLDAAVRFDEYDVFNDFSGQRSARIEPPRNATDSIASGVVSMSFNSVESMVPSLDDITEFYSKIFRRSQMEADCIIMSLIYVERLIKDTAGGVRPRLGNWRSVLFACMVMSSKVWDDLSMWNVDFSQACPTGVKFPLKRINELELAMLQCLKFDVKVMASEYAKYYFLLRSMAIKSGLAGQDLIDAKALDVDGARKLEDLSSRFQWKATRNDDNDDGVRQKITIPMNLTNGRRAKSTSEFERTSPPWSQTKI